MSSTASKPVDVAQKGVVRICSNTLPVGADGNFENVSVKIVLSVLPAAAIVVGLWFFKAIKSDASNMPSPTLTPTAARAAEVKGLMLTDCPVAPTSLSNAMPQTVGVFVACPLMTQGNGWLALRASETAKLQAPSVDVVWTLTVAPFTS